MPDRHRFHFTKDKEGTSHRKAFLGFSLGRADSNEHEELLPVLPALLGVTHTASHPHPQHPYAQEHLSDPSEHHSLMIELKRFFRPLKKGTVSSSEPSHSASVKPVHPVLAAEKSDHDSTVTQKKDVFHVDSSLSQKYGTMGKVLGSGAGGSVRLLTRELDHKTFAVKEFRARRPNESTKEYAKKCTAEFCIGSTLHHPNIIQTLDIICENNRYFEVMEYCPVDFFAVVMSGKMGRAEINCCLKQILEGLNYLHGMGLAHRDMKLDNCVMTRSGIIKLIDFGSAVVFRYPFEDQFVRATGVVGSDPYLAPEILHPENSDGLYDPQAVDVWSLAIIYCCMTLRRFPWKAPKHTDVSFHLFTEEDDQPHDYIMSNEQHRLLLQQRRLKAIPGLDHADLLSEIESKLQTLDLAKKALKDTFEATRGPAAAADAPKSKTVHGPYRLMRLLPHASRHLISRMLLLNPTTRATLKEVMADEWIRGILACTMRGEEVVAASNHTHTVVEDEVSGNQKEPAVCDSKL